MPVLRLFLLALQVREIANEFNMDPTKTELMAMDDMEGAFKWTGMKQSLREALDDTMGKITNFRDIVLCPASVWQAAVLGLRVIVQAAVPEVAPQGVQGQAGSTPGRPEILRIDRPLNVIEAAQVVSLRRVARLRCNEPAEETPPGGGGSGQGQQQQASGGASVTALDSNKLQVKSMARISEVIDQGDHSEVTPWSPDRVRATLAVYKMGNKGVPAKAAYTPTALQFAALEFKLRTSGSAFVDFGVWRPNGGRLERRMRLTVHYRNARGDWLPHEISGPMNFREWQRGWRVFVVAMRGLDEADQPSFNEFEEVVEELVTTYGEECWWIVAQGEGRMRSERMPVLFHDAVEEKEKAEKKGEVHALDLRRPWDYLFRKAAGDRDFWGDEVKEKCMRWMGRIDSSSTVAEEGFGAVHPGNSGLTELQGGGAGGGGGRGGKPKAARSASSDSSEAGGGAKRRRRRAAKKAKGGRAGGGGGRGAKAKAASPPRGRKVAPNPRFNKEDARGKDKGKGKGKGKGDGLYRRTAAGKEICYKYSRDGACSDPCPNSRAHVCEHCLQHHKTADCRQH